MNTTLVPSKYTTALLTVGLTVVAALQAALVEGIDVVESLQLLALLVGGIVTYIVPLLAHGWAAFLKVAGAVLGAVLVAAIGVFESLTTGANFWSTETIVLLFFAGLNALAAQFGVDQRVDTAKEALASPSVSNKVPGTVDPTATAAAQSEGAIVSRAVPEGYHGK